MSDATHTTFSRVISDRHFLTGSLIPATILALVAACFCLVSVLSVGGIARLLSDQTAGTLTTELGERFPQPQLKQVVEAIPALSRPGFALTFLFGAIVVATILRALLHAGTERQINRRVATNVNRLREHIHRQALRSNPGDLTGAQRRTAANLFQMTAQKLEDSAARWGLLKITTTCDLLVLAAVLLLIQWRVGLECLIPMVACWYIARVESERNSASANLLSEQVDRGLQRLTEDLDKARIVAGYGMESVEHDYFAQNLKQYQSRCDGLQRQKRRGRWTSLLIRIAMVMLPAFIIARHIVFGNLIGLPAASMLVAALGIMMMSLNRSIDAPRLRGTATVAADEINQYLLRVPPVSQVVGARFLEPMSRLLQFNQVSVETETNPDLLCSLDLKIEFGKRVSLIALNPREAEALVTLIPRFADPSAGQVLFDGQDIRRATLESLRAEAVIVGGDEPVFHTTVLDNVTAGRTDISRQDAIEACKTVHAENFIRRLSKGYETHLGESATTLDVGQRFRLSLARAVARKPALLIIQEPETVLDNETKTMLDDTYQRICTGRTVIFLPSRLSTVKKCDRIVMLHQGRVVADGRHEDLVRTSDLYRHWEYIRFNVFRGGANGAT
ncbi:MAG: ABC transporter ATP-binding protein [Planctomycetaceae bacterium]